MEGIGLSAFEFVIQAEGELLLPEYKGSTLRGAFGSHIVRLTEEGRSRLLAGEAESPADPPAEAPELEAHEEKEAFIEDFIPDKIAQLIKRIKGGEDHAQAAA